MITQQECRSRWRCVTTRGRRQLYASRMPVHDAYCVSIKCARGVWCSFMLPGKMVPAPAPGGLLISSCAFVVVALIVCASLLSGSVLGYWLGI